MRATILCSIVALTSAVTVAQKPPERYQDSAPTNASSIDELKKFDRELDVAFEKGDASFIQHLLAEEMINVMPEGNISRKTEFLQAVKPPKTGTILTITEKDVQVFLVGETGIVTSNKTAKWQRSNGSFSDDYRETNTYVRRDGQWSLLALQTSHAPPPYTAKDVNLSLTVDDTQIGGNRNASVVLIEFADYECPYCRDFASKTMKQIEHDYIDSGRIGFVFHDFPIESSHPHAFGAALAALCAGEQGHLWEMNHKLLAESSALERDNLFRDAESMKLDMTKFQGCFADDKTSTRLRQLMREAGEIGIDGTPMFVLGIRKPGSNTIKGLRLIEGGYPYEVFKATLDMLIATQN
ncbi:MAG TPA: thioredoxin domain-containing protein [Pyrinomonadaceae bacterium]|jgi:protein-disulfide isomerase|nr:thioredoxin domain-containing protein [Pyrinomonadaceae bacterium]